MSTYELARCPVCHGAETVEVADADAVRREVEALWEFHGSRLKPDTPPEHLTDRVAFSQDPPLRVVRCVVCGMVYRNPRERAREVRAVYAGEVPSLEVMRALLATQRSAYAAQARRLTEVAAKPGRGLEVGSYVGGFLAAARDAGWQFEGVDINEAINAFAREQGFRVTTGEIADVDAEGAFDAVAIWNCFDQLPDPRAAARAARRLLRPGGVLAIRVPNGGFYATVRGWLAGPAASIARELLAQNNLLSFPYRHGFTAGALDRLLGETGFTVVRAYGDTLVPVADEWTRPWAAIEERAVKAMLGLVAHADADRAPWVEVYGVA